MTQRTIGLFGGSFDPPHSGHVDFTLQALKRFGLDHLWWLVSPGNPLKPNGPAPMEHRMEAARGIMDHPKVTISDIEARIGTRYTAQTLRYLVDRNPHVQFVWLMGADNLGQFNQWKEWRWIIETVPIGVLARPKSRLNALTSQAAKTYAHRRLPSHASHLLGRTDHPMWCYANMPLNPMSSTALRASK